MLVKVDCYNPADLQEFLSDMGNAWQAGIWATYDAVLYHMLNRPARTERRMIHFCNSLDVLLDRIPIP